MALAPLAGPPLSYYLSQLSAMPELERALIDYVLSEWFRDIGGAEYADELQGRFLATVEQYKHAPRQPSRSTLPYRAL